MAIHFPTIVNISEGMMDEYREKLRDTFRKGETETGTARGRDRQAEIHVDRNRDIQRYRDKLMT